ncbi:hypothetical protein I4U23_020245 [Adineta vaga]|nr:hypothetical protein I4U23_020245 [Adineta vaga]
MLNSSNSISIYSSLNLLSILLDTIAVCICITFLFTIICRLIRNRFQRDQTSIDVTLIPSINTICIICVKSILQIIHVTIPTIMNDFHINNIFYETPFCRFRSYMLWAVIVIYPKQSWLHQPSFYLFILIPFQFIIEFIGILPALLIFDGMHLLSNEAYCNILFQSFYILIYVCMIGFGIPYTILCIFHFWIGRQMRLSTIRVYHKQNRRDYIVVRRMLLNSIILSIVTIPYFILYIRGIIQNHFDPIIYRIQWLSSSLSSCLFSLSLPFITTQLYNLLLKSNC